MMLDINLDRLREGFWRYLPLGAVVALIMVAQMVLVVGGKYFGLIEMPLPAPRSATFSNTKELGRLIYTDYVYPFELAAVVLLVAIVAAIALTMRRRKDSKHVDPAQQVMAKRAGRVRLVSLSADKQDAPSTNKI